MTSRSIIQKRKEKLEMRERLWRFEFRVRLISIRSSDRLKLILVFLLTNDLAGVSSRTPIPGSISVDQEDELGCIGSYDKLMQLLLVWLQ